MACSPFPDSGASHARRPRFSTSRAIAKARCSSTRPAASARSWSCGGSKATPLAERDGPSWNQKVLFSRFEGPWLSLCASDGADSEPMKGCAIFIEADDAAAAKRCSNVVRGRADHRRLQAAVLGRSLRQLHRQVRRAMGGRQCGQRSVNKAGAGLAWASLDGSALGLSPVQSGLPIADGRFSTPARIAVMPGLDPGIHPLQEVDCRDKPGHDEHTSRGNSPWRPINCCFSPATASAPK